mgnify:FL=1
MDPITLLGIASSAFSTLKKGFELGREAETMIKDVGRFMHSVDDIKGLHKQKKKRTFGSVEEESLETFVAQKKARKMEDELRNFIIASYGIDSWNQILAIQVKLRKERAEMLAQKKRDQEHVIKIFLVFISTIVISAIGIFGYLQFAK